MEVILLLLVLFVIGGAGCGISALIRINRLQRELLASEARLRKLEKVLLRTFLTPWSYVASLLYHDFYWYPFVGFWRARRALRTRWGELFRNFEKRVLASLSKSEP